jgi:hypothetical protein
MTYEDREAKDRRKDLLTWGVTFEATSLCHSYRVRPGKREARNCTSIITITLEVHEQVKKGIKKRKAAKAASAQGGA